MFDAIVVGARCAGSPTAMLLAARGLRVLVVDKASLSSDVISTHMFHPRGSTHLRRWGLLDRVIGAGTPVWSEHCTTLEGITLRASLDEAALRERLVDVHGWNEADLKSVTMTWCAPRRRVLDPILAEAADEAGAMVRLDFEVTGLLREGDRVVGVEARTPTGQTVTERARVAVGADGRYSSVAQWVGAAEYNHRPRCTYCYYSYWDGLSLDGLDWPLHLRGRQAVTAFPTNDGLIQVMVYGPREWFQDFRRDVEGNFMRVARTIYSPLADRLQDARRVERIYGTADQPNKFLVSAGPGWALAGDAGLRQDQCTAIGMTHAFRDAELLAQAIDDGLKGRRPLDEALVEYQRLRDLDSVEYHEFLCGIAECNPARLDQELALAAAMRGNSKAISRFFSVFTDALKPSAFFAPEHMGAIFGAARSDLPEPEIFRCYEARLAEAMLNPWVRPGEGSASSNDSSG